MSEDYRGVKFDDRRGVCKIKLPYDAYRGILKDVSFVSDCTNGHLVFGENGFRCYEINGRCHFCLRVSPKGNIRREKDVDVFKLTFFKKQLLEEIEKVKMMGANDRS